MHVRCPLSYKFALLCQTSGGDAFRQDGTETMPRKYAWVFIFTTTRRGLEERRLCDAYISCSNFQERYRVDKCCFGDAPRLCSMTSNVHVFTGAHGQLRPSGRCFINHHICRVGALAVSISHELNTPARCS